MIPQETLDRIRDATSIEALIGETVHLKRVGSSYLGLCPFHAESTPSFNVRESVGRYHCFGCHAAGDVFSFLMETLSISFTDAVKYLGSKCGIAVEDDDAAAPEKRLPIKEALAAAHKHYMTQRHPAVTQFFDDRYADAATMTAEWGTGFSAKGTLIPALKAQGFDMQTLKEAGLVNDKGYETFRNRLMWPIIDPLGRVVGFGARKLLETDTVPGKFINSPATKLYNKSEVLFNIRKAQQAIRSQKDHKTAIVVEGYMDVYSMHVAGLPQTVAPCGTAITETHLATLRRLVGENGEIVMATDGDNAGVEAALAVLQKTKGHGFFSVMAMPPGDDPDTVRIRDGAKALHTLFVNRVPLVQFLLHHAISKTDRTTPEGIAAAETACASILAHITNPTLLTKYTDWVAGELHTTYQNVQDAVHRTDAPRPDTKKQHPQILELTVLRLIYQRPTEAMAFRELLCDPTIYLHEPYRNAIAALPDWDPTYDPAQWRGLLRETLDPAILRLLYTGLGAVYGYYGIEDHALTLAQQCVDALDHRQRKIAQAQHDSTDSGLRNACLNFPTSYAS